MPADIVGTYGKREELFSLRTKDPKEALRLVRVKAVEVDQKFETHRQSLSAVNACAAVGHPSGPTKLVSIASHRQSIIDEEFARRAKILQQVEADVDTFFNGGFVQHPCDERYYCLAPTFRATNLRCLC